MKIDFNNELPSHFGEESDSTFPILALLVKVKLARNEKMKFRRSSIQGWSSQQAALRPVCIYGRGWARKALIGADFDSD